MPGPVQRRRLVLASVFFTNLLALACQVLWVRKLSFLFGSTAAVFATVLSVFLLGLAVGALAGGRWADRTPDRLRALARIFLLLGIWCAVSIPLFDLGRAAYLAVVPLGMSPVATAASKAVVVLLCLLVPTAAIGAVFPLAVRLVAEDSASVGRELSLVYALDTLGAASGALLGGFLLVPHVGLWGSTLLLGGAAVVVGVRLWLQPSASAAPRQAKKHKKEKKRKDARSAGAAPPVGEAGLGASRDAAPPALPGWRAVAVLVTFFCTGLAALLLETGWNRFFYVLNGTSVSSLAIVLAGFLGGLGAGSFAMRRALPRVRDPLTTVAVLFAVVALGGVLVLRSSGLFERAYFAAFAMTSSYVVFQLLVCTVVFAIVFLAALAMGANFPLVTMIAARDPRTRGFSVGLVFCVNTLGGVVGALLGEFVLLPRAGFEGLALAALTIYALAAVAFLVLARPLPIGRAAAATTALLAGAVVLSPLALPFDLPVHALYYHGLRAGSYAAYRQEIAGMKTRWQADGFYGRVAVVAYGPYLLLKHNGKTDASDGGDNYAQFGLSEVPLLLHPRPRKVLNIGLGGGLTLRGIVHHPEVESITSVEIDPLVVEAARNQFAAINDRALEDPRVQSVIADGRNYVEATAKKFDVIISEPPNIWVAGVAGLFTREFYVAARARLEPGGILSQWLPVHELEEEDFAIGLRTLRSVFPHVAVWSNGSDAIVLAAEQPFVADPAALQEKLAAAGIRRDLAALGVRQETVDGLEGWLQHPQFPEAVVARLADSVSAINTDNLPLLEFRTARNLFAFNQPDYRRRGAPR
ncbi:MAG: fused MFS/spermidine synthase [Acidobacteriota bacterium]